MFSFESLFGRPRIPKECCCGDTHNEMCSQVGLRNHRDFPPFAFLPEENDVDESYYAPDDGGFMYSPIRHWALVGEIAKVTYFIRPRVVIRTQFEEDVLVNFHLDEPRPTFFDWPDLKPSSTLVIMYAVNRTFADMNNGIRQESPDTVVVFPTSLPKLVKEFEGYQVFEKEQIKKCFNCGAVETEERRLMKCTRCKKAYYCDRDCQLSSWKCSHKNLCKYAQMLTKLAGLDFSRFDGFVDWNFPTISPLSAEEKKANAERAQRDALYRMGAVIDSMPKRFGRFLSSIEHISIESDPILKMFWGGIMFDQGSLPSTVGETFLFKSLREFQDRISEEPDMKQFVVDLNNQGDVRNRSIAHFTSDIVLSALFFALPLWQHNECVGGISWSLESHYPLSSKMKVFEDVSVWDTTGGGDSVLVKNRISQTCTFMSDDMRMVAEIGEKIASNNSKDMVLRVIRATGNESWEDSIRSIASKCDIPTNMFTLWIREDVPMCGRFNPPNPSLSAADQLLDRRPFSMIETLLGGLGVPEENIIQRFPSGDSSARGGGSSGLAGLDEQVCFSCGELKAKQHYSKTQLRKYRNEARCKDCIAQF